MALVSEIQHLHIMKDRIKLSNQCAWTFWFVMRKLACSTTTTTLICPIFLRRSTEIRVCKWHNQQSGVATAADMFRLSCLAPLRDYLVIRWSIELGRNFVLASTQKNLCESSKRDFEVSLRSIAPQEWNRLFSDCSPRSDRLSPRSEEIIHP